MAGYTGAHCEIKMDPCKDYCYNDGLCKLNESTARPECKCRPEYTGLFYCFRIIIILQNNVFYEFIGISFSSLDTLSTTYCSLRMSRLRGSEPSF